MLNQLESYANTKENRENTVLKSGNTELINRFKKAQAGFQYYYDLLYPHKNNIIEFNKLCELHKINYGIAKNEYVAVVKEIKELQNFEINTKTQAIETKTYINTLGTDILKLAIKPVEGTNNRFSYGMYGDFKVLIMNSNGYINAKCIIAEALEHENNLRVNRGEKPLNTKLFAHWKENKATGELYEALKVDLGIPIITLEEQFKGGEYNLRFLQGTYIHPELVNSLAMWVSPTYALQINRIINNININKAEQKLNALLQEKDDKIDKLQKSLKELIEINKKQTNDLQELTNINKQQTNDIQQLKIINKQNNNDIQQLTIINKKNNNNIQELTDINKQQTNDLQQLLSYGKETKSTINSINSSISTLYSKAIEPKKEENGTLLILFDNNIGTHNTVIKNVTKIKTSDDSEIELVQELYPFTFIRRQIKTIGKSIDSHFKKYPQAREIIRCKIANSVLSLNNIKNDLNNKIKGKYNDFVLKQDYQKNQFIIDISKIIYEGTNELKQIENLTSKYNY